ncbi:MAG TPA: hypothetical protein VJR46_07305, partial [Candidatus Dormibacteraeota bacterium]|nr:hypothetical protein [Candidatus Dormibacteraeota bacterium]
FGQRELGPGIGDGAGNVSSHNNNGVNRSRSIEHTAASVTGAPVAAGVGVSSTGPVTVVTTFDGLNHRNQRRANKGNQFSLEPPDQGLCVGNGVELEVINDVMKIYSPSGGTVKGTEDLNTFFGYPAQFNRAMGLVGPFVTDPSCLFDSATNRWFLDVLTLEVFPTTGDFTGENHLDLAVSQTGDPTGGWNFYHVQVQDDGNNGTPNHGCAGIPPFGNPRIPPTFKNACIGDYPHLGADAFGVYLTTNEYSLFGNDFHGAQVYAFSKAALASGASSVAVTQFDTHGLDNGNSGFTLWPANAPAANFNTSAGGTEYFLSSNAADEAHGNGANPGPRRSTQLLVWTLTHTSTLDSASPSLSLSHNTLSVGLYVVPARSEQKVGSTPIADCLNMHACATQFLLGVPDPFAPNHEYDIDSNDTRMQQVVYARGLLWGALDTAVNSSANTRAGIEWFVVNPAGNASLVNSGYLAVSQNNVTYPAIAVRPDGKGVMAFTLEGRDFYPTAAFASMDAGGVGAVQLAAEGAGPADGFSGYAVYNAPNPARPRWGDYGAAVVDGSNIWVASEYIGQTCTLRTYLATLGSCGGTRTALANWDTRITEVTPA